MNTQGCSLNAKSFSFQLNEFVIHVCIDVEIVVKHDDHIISVWDKFATLEEVIYDTLQR